MKNILALSLLFCSLGIFAQNYSPIDTDTVRWDTTLHLMDGTYRLEIKYYSLNDSAVKPKSSSQVFHNYTSKVTMFKDGKTIFSRTVNKNSFGPKIARKLYNQITLKSTRYEFERSNRVNFVSELVNPANGKTYEFNCGIYYTTEEVGEMTFWGVRISD